MYEFDFYFLFLGTVWIVRIYRMFESFIYSLTLYCEIVLIRLVPLHVFLRSWELVYAPETAKQPFSTALLPLLASLTPSRNPNVWLHPLQLKHLIRNFRDSRDRSAHQPVKIDFTCACSHPTFSRRFCSTFLPISILLSSISHVCCNANNVRNKSVFYFNEL